MGSSRPFARAARLASLIVFACACGGRPPPPIRGVIEDNVDSWSFRRYQKVLDVEVWVAGNPAVAYTASYVEKSVLKRGRLGEGDVVNTFVTRYESNAGILRALVVFARRLAQESGYQVAETRVGGTRVFLVTGHSEAWALWSAPKHVVKVGGRGLPSVPATLVSGYARIYPSGLPSGSLEGELPPAEPDPNPDKPQYDPARPTPDWQTNR